MKFLDVLRSNIAELEAKRSEHLNAMDVITASCERSGRSKLTADQSKRFDEARDAVAELDGHLEVTRARVAELEEVERRNLAATVAPVESPWVSRSVSHDVDLVRQSPAALRGQARTVAESLRARDGVREAVTQAVERAFDLSEVNGAAMSAWAIASSDENYVTAFAELARNGQMAVLSDEQRLAVQRAQHVYRAMSIGTPGAGGYGLPVVIDPSIVLSDDGYVDPMRRICRQVTIATDAWKGITSTGVTAEWKAENAAAAETVPTLVQPEVDTHLNDVFVPFSFEVGQDYPDLVAELSRIASDAAGDLESDAFWGGDGNGKPTGIINSLDASTTTEVVVTTDGTFTKTDVYKAAAAVPDRFWENSTWAANRATWFHVRQMADTTSGANNAAFWADFGPGTPSTLLGQPVVTASAVPAFTGTTGASNFLVVGDFSNYLVVNRISSAEIVPHLFDVTNNRPTLTRGFLMYRRVGGKALVPNAFRLLQNT